MRFTRKIVFSLLLTLVCFCGISQDFSNKGTDFWVGYAMHVGMFTGTGGPGAGGGSQNMVLYFTSDQTANVTVTIPATGWSASYVVNPNTVTETTTLPKTGASDVRLNEEGVFAKGIHITSDRPVVAYTHVYDGSVSGASLLFPTNTLGQDYYVLGYTQVSNANNSYPFAFAIATEDSTVVEVTPSVATQFHAAGVPFTQSLRKGEVLNLLGQISGQSGVDLTGTRIRSISVGNASCKRIAVFCGTGKLNIRCNPGGNSSADNTIQQCFPSNAWGKKYITVPTRDMPNNVFRVMVNDPATIVRLNGSVLSNLQNGRYYEFQSNVTNIIEADKPVMAAQFITTANQCNNTALGSNGDPEMIYLSAVEQTISKITLNSTSHAAISPNYHYINVVLKRAGVGSFTLDGVSVASSFTTLPNDPTFAYAQFKTTAGIHNLAADSGFNAIAYGYGNAESYGYNAGTNVLDLYQFVSLQNQYATVNFPATCKNTPFLFSITLPYLATSLKWDFSNNPDLQPNAIIANNSPVPDSSFVRDGRTLYVYKLPGSYKFTATGTFPIKVFANNPTSDGCSGSQEINYDVVVYDPPKANFTFANSGCLSDSVRFTETSNGFGRPFIKWNWDFGDATRDSVKNPVKKYLASGTYTVQLKTITDIGCIADTSRILSINNPPVSKFGVSTPACAGTAVAFNDSSTVDQGTIVKWTWNFGNGNTLVNTSNPVVGAVYSNPGTYVVSLQVESASGCKSNVFTKSILVGARPTPNFSLANVCLPSGIGQFQNLTSITDGSVATIKYLWNFGDGGTDSVTNPVHNYQSPGPFTITLKATALNGCSKDTTRLMTNIFAAPKANFAVTSEVCLRDTTMFTDQSSGSGNQVVKWRWDFGDGTTDTVQNPKHKYNLSGTYTVKLFILTDKGCVSDTLSKSTLVNVLPIADFSISTPQCSQQSITFTSTSSIANGAITQWNWTFGNGNSLSDLTGNAAVNTYLVAGNYSPMLFVVSAKGCKSDTILKPLVINQPPVAYFSVPDVCLSDASAQFTDSSYHPQGNVIASYLWNFGDANSTPGNLNTSSQKNGVHKYTATGNYNVSLTVTSSQGCSATFTRPFTVNGDIPVSSFTIAQSQQLCSNNAVLLQNTSSVNFGRITKVEIYWDALGSPTQFDTDLTVTPNKVYAHQYTAFQAPASKTYLVRFLAYSGGTCVDVKTQTITVLATPKVSVSAISSTCLNEAGFQLNAASESSGLSGTGTWSGTGVSTSGFFNPLTSGFGTFSLQYLYTANNGCRDSARQNISVYPVPVVNAGPDLFVLEGGSLKIDATASGNSLSYRWTPATYLDNDTSLKPITSAIADVTYKLTARSAEGCSASDQVIVKVLKTPEIPNAFSPNGDGINDTWRIRYLESYPAATVQVFNRYGQMVFNSVGYNKPWDGAYNGYIMPVGVYYYIIDPKSGRKQMTGSITILR